MEACPGHASHAKMRLPGQHVSKYPHNLTEGSEIEMEFNTRAQRNGQFLKIEEDMILIPQIPSKMFYGVGRNPRLNMSARGVECASGLLG